MQEKTIWNGKKRLSYKQKKQEQEIKTILNKDHVQGLKI